MSVSKVTAPIAPQNEFKAVDRVSGGAPHVSTSFFSMVDAAANRIESSQDRHSSTRADNENSNRSSVRERATVRDRQRADIRGERNDRIERKDLPADQPAAAEETQSDSGKPADDAVAPSGSEPVAPAAQAAETAPAEQQKASAVSGAVVADVLAPDVAAQAGGDGLAGILTLPQQAVAPQGGAAAGDMPSGVPLPQDKGPAQAIAAAPATAQSDIAAQAAAQAAADAQAAAQPADPAQPDAPAQSTPAAAPPAMPQAAQLSGLLSAGEAVKVQAVTADPKASAPPAPSGQLLDGGGIFTQNLANGGDGASQMASNGEKGNGSGDQTQQARLLAQLTENDGRPETGKAKESQVFSSLLNAQMAAEPSTAATASPGLANGIGEMFLSATPLSSSHGVSSLAPAGQASAAQSARPQPATPLHDQIGVHMAKAAKDGISRINIELNPLELGKIEVRLDMSQDGRVIANIIADSRDTLSMLQQDAQGLQRTLQDAGLQADSGSLNFHLRGQERQFSQAGNDRRGSNGRRDADVMETADVALTAKPQETLTADGGLDIRI